MWNGTIGVTMTTTLQSVQGQQSVRRTVCRCVCPTLRASPTTVHFTSEERCLRAEWHHQVTHLPLSFADTGSVSSIWSTARNNDSESDQSELHLLHFLCTNDDRNEHSCQAHYPRDHRSKSLCQSQQTRVRRAEPSVITRSRHTGLSRHNQRSSWLRYLLITTLLVQCTMTLVHCTATTEHGLWHSRQSRASIAHNPNAVLKNSKSRSVSLSLPSSTTHRMSTSYPSSSSYVSHSSRGGPIVPDSTSQTNYQQYYNTQLMSMPFSQSQLLFRNQMLPHHSPFNENSPLLNPSSSNIGASHSVTHSTNIHKNKLQSNNLPTNSARPKGSKWWDIGRNPSVPGSTQSANKHPNANGRSGQMLTDRRHENSILTVSSSSSSATVASANSVSVSNYNLPLRKKQRRLVKENPGMLGAIMKAMGLAISECQNQLKDHRWNCPVNEWKKGKNVFGKIVQSGCRETAFVYALTSAAVAHSLARACSEGLIDTCTCDYTKRLKEGGDDWGWGGCSDNIKFGYKQARAFVDAAERGHDQRFVMNLHNNEAGRLHVEKEMRRECKCHGMSGSCTVKTCWMRLASFREIGNNLKERFDKASRVRVNNDYRGITRKKHVYKKSGHFETYEKGYPQPTNTDLVFFEESPNFCTANHKYGLSGTQGRQCNASSISVDSCNLLCCDRGYVTEEMEVTERCNCTFRWCCEVTCNLCKVKKQIFKCK